MGLGRGAWILENRPILSDSPKADSVRLAFSRADGLDGDTWAQGLHEVMKSHEVPERSKRTPASVRPLETEAPLRSRGSLRDAQLDVRSGARRRDSRRAFHRWAAVHRIARRRQRPLEKRRALIPLRGWR